ncbi:MAG: hypothetical protein ACREJC_14850, partial [Tepidisphaeraceae bacterium]
MRFPQHMPFAAWCIFIAWGATTGLIAVRGLLNRKSTDGQTQDSGVYTALLVMLGAVTCYFLYQYR